MPNMIWVRMFIEAQGYKLEENILFQDNQSAIKIELNGKRSSGQKTKRMDNRYFWIKDRLTTEGIKIEYCPTLKMLADFFTKPLQGSLFRKFRDYVLGYQPVETLINEVDTPLQQERVGKEGKENWGNGSNGIRTTVEEKKKEKTVTWADITRGNGDEKRVLANVME